MKPYSTAKNKLVQIADHFSYTKGWSPFKGKNFITPYIVCVGRFSNGVWFELSFGENITRTDWLYGVTLKGSNPELVDIQGCCQSLVEVNEKMVAASEL